MRVVLTIVLTTLSITCSAQINIVEILRQVRGGFEKDSVIAHDIYGSILERETHQPVADAHIILEGDSGTVIRTGYTDGNGAFVFEKVRIGRYVVRVSHIVFERASMSVEVASGKQVIVQIPLDISSKVLREVEVRADNGVDRESIGGNTISAEMLEKLPGTRMDVSRKVAQDPAVYVIDDSRNDIIVRGNSPQSIRWRIEGINIPNPNHFSIPGTSGGPVSIISDKMVAASTFYSGAFPAGYGNTVAGIFDLKLRNGRSESHGGSIQLGFLGFETALEGPLKKAKDYSYLFSFRRSTLGMFDFLGIDIGTTSVPWYGDFAFKLNFPSAIRNSNFSVFGIGGNSKIDLKVSDLPDTTIRNFYGEKDRNQYFGSSMRTIGMNYTRQFRKTNKYVSHTFAFSSESIFAKHTLVYPIRLRQMINQKIGLRPTSPNLPLILDYRFEESRISGYSSFTNKVGSNGYFNVGASYDYYFFDFHDRAMSIDTANQLGTWRTRWDSHENAFLIQPFIQRKYSKNNLTLNIGLHGQYFSLNHSYSVEPRGSFVYQLKTQAVQRLSGSVGLHSQMQQPYVYFYGPESNSAGKPITVNKSMDFTRSFQAVLGYERVFGSRLDYRFKTEVYYQGLYNVPVEKNSSHFSMINAGADFKRIHAQELENTGAGRNRGVELTLEKTLTRGYLFLITGSVFESTYRGSDMKWRSTDFNARGVFNALFTREFYLKNENVFSVGARFTIAGGRWESAWDPVETNKNHDVVFDPNGKNIRQYDPYKRFDIRVTYKINWSKVSCELSADIINAFDWKNVLKQTYIPYVNRIGGTVEPENQLGILPFFYAKLEF